MQQMLIETQRISSVAHGRCLRFPHAVLTEALSSQSSCCERYRALLTFKPRAQEKAAWQLESAAMRRLWFYCGLRFQQL
jgi:hypothetical protein